MDYRTIEHALVLVLGSASLLWLASHFTLRIEEAEMTYGNVKEIRLNFEGSE